MAMNKVFINPGHCPGVDPGAVNGAYTEAQIALEIGQKVAAYLEAAGCEVKLLQSDNLCGESPSYPNVCRTANDWQADIFVSLHCNAASPAAKGTETLVFSKWSKSDTLAHCIQKQIVNKCDTVDRGVKERPKLAVLRGTYMTATLVEMAFISNDDDLSNLLHNSDAFARAIAVGITDYLQEA